MTSTSFPFSTMEVPSVDDNMEMASPYQGPVDDFEIDIDAMEDQASNADRDMTAADDYMENSHEENHEHNGLPDEDMVDDEAEPSMVDADEYAETGQNILEFEEVKTDDERKTYEADMLEDDYDQDLDAAAVESENQAPVALASADAEQTSRVEPGDEEKTETGGKDHTEPQPQAELQELDESQARRESDSKSTAHCLHGEHPVEEVEPTEPAEPVEKVEEAEPTHVEARPTEDLAEDTNITEKVEKTEPQTIPDNHEETHEDWQDPDDRDKESNQPQPLAEEQKEAEVEDGREQQVSEPNDREADQGHARTETPPLYPVKVYYQDNEISLFPPREGDASETFFLEDESLAYESFSTLISACREVLQNHISENEVLVIDIETMNFQLTEDSRETHNFSLKQLVDVYLQLCHNDGVEEPEALYLTLSTRLTAAAELSDLIIAASEGKGLSEIQSWEVYPEEGATKYEDAAQEPLPEEHQDTSDDQDKEASFEAQREPTSHGEETLTRQEDELDANENQPIANDAAEQSANDARNSEDRVSVHEPESPNAPTHKSEERRTDSTGTLEPLPTTDAPEDRPDSGEVSEQVHDDDYEEGEYHDDEEAGEYAYQEDYSLENPEQSFDNVEKHETDYTGDLTEEHPEENHALESNHQERRPSEKGAEDGAAKSQEYVDEDVDANESHPLDSSKVTEPTLDGNLAEKSEESQHVVNDSLAVAEDVKSVEGDSKTADQAGFDNVSEPGEVDETTEHENAFDAADGGEEAELPFEDEEDYLDLGIADDLGDFDPDQGNASTSHVPGKRTREPDDELELPGSSTPEAKRTRSS